MRSVFHGSRSRSRFTHIQAFIRKELSIHTSPEVISRRLQLEFGISISKNTLYRYIQLERQAGGELYQQL
ncbi:integrase domain protein, partial [Candidatus Erwinia dacicola]